MSRPLLANWHKNKHTPLHTHLTTMPNFILLGRKLWPPNSRQFFWTDQQSDLWSFWSQLKNKYEIIKIVPVFVIPSNKKLVEKIC